MLTAALAALLLMANAESAAHPSGFALMDLGSSSTAPRPFRLPAASWRAGASPLHAIIGGAGDDWDYERKQVAADLQWRFWGYRGFVRPWVGLGMAWGSIHAYHRDEVMPGVNTRVWEYFRASAGVDVVIAEFFAIGPWGRLGVASRPDIDPSSTFLATCVFGLRMGVGAAVR